MIADPRVPPNNIEAEQCVIGSLMLGIASERVEKVLSWLKPEAFFNKYHRVIYTEILELHRSQMPLDLITLTNHLDNKGLTEMVGGFAYLAELCTYVPSAANISAYAVEVRDKAMMRYGIEKTTEMMALFYETNGLTAVERYEAAQRVFTELSDHAKTGKRTGFRPFMDWFGDWAQEVDQRFSDPESVRGLTTGIPGLDKLMEPKLIVRGSLFVIGARPKMGKAMALGAKILLQDGTWTTHGKIQVGQQVASVDGLPSVVTGVFPQGTRRMYQVIFEDGRIVKAADSHLWEISSSRFDGERVVDTEKLEEMLQKERYQGRLCIPSASGDFGVSADHLDGWVLGALLGDGSLTMCVKFTNSEDYVLSRMAASVPNLKFIHTGKNDYVISHRRGCKNPLTEKLREYGLMGKAAHEKEIPESIFSADKETRIGVLAGLLETDGWVEKFGCIRFSSASKKLSQGMVRLVHSLGGSARETTRTNISYTYKGETLQGLDAQMVSMKLPDAILEHIKSPRLRANLGVNRLGNRGVGIRSVIEVEPEECLCIMVSHPRHLYITNDYIVTHNTTFLQQMAINCALVEKKPTLLFSLEMPGIQMVERTISQMSRVNSETFYPEKFDDTQFSIASAKAMELAESDNIFIDDTPGITLSYIQAEGRRLKREKGTVGMILVDYLTLMEPEKSERTSLGFGMITKGLKNLAKELGCVVVLLTQLNRGVEGRTVKRPRPSDSRETGSIEQDCDYWVGIHADEDESGIPDLSLTEYILSLNRHGRTGVCFAEQRDGVLYELDQYHASEMARTRTANKTHQSNKKGGY